MKRNILQNKFEIKECGTDIPVLNLDAERIRSKVDEKLTLAERERMIKMKRKNVKIITIAAVICVLVFTTAFASPTVRDKIGEIISYFSDDRAVDITNTEQLMRFNKNIGKSVSKNGYTLILDNVAADDNFVHVFYTIKSNDKPLSNKSDELNIWEECVIDGSIAGRNNNSSTNGYFADLYTYKCAKKINISTVDIPDKFMLELYVDIGEYEESKSMSELYEGKTITDEEKNKIWYISTEIDKSAIKVESVTKTIGIKLPDSIAKVEKAVFSPFGNQLVITTEANGGDVDNIIGEIDSFALYDENNICLDVLNTGLGMNYDGSSVNSFEFLKADLNTKKLKFVPIKFSTKTSDSKIIYKPAGNYPCEYKTSNYGKVVVTDVKIKDGEIDIEYYKDGFVLYDPVFIPANNAGENIEPGGKFGCVCYVDVHHETNSYTARYVYESEEYPSVPESAKAEALKKSFEKLGVVENDGFILDFDNAVTVNLQ